MMSHLSCKPDTDRLTRKQLRCTQSAGRLFFASKGSVCRLKQRLWMAVDYYTRTECLVLFDEPGDLELGFLVPDGSDIELLLDF